MYKFNFQILLTIPVGIAKLFLQTVHYMYYYTRKLWIFLKGGTFSSSHVYIPVVSSSQTSYSNLNRISARVEYIQTLCRSFIPEFTFTNPNLTVGPVPVPLQNIIAISVIITGVLEKFSYIISGLMVPFQKNSWRQVRNIVRGQGRKYFKRGVA